MGDTNDGVLGVLERMRAQAGQFRCDCGRFPDRELIRQTAEDKHAVNAIAELLAAAEPFATFNNSDGVVKLHVPSSHVKRLRTALRACKDLPK